MSIAVESGIPVPSVKRGLSLPFEEMDVGDSFALSVPEGAKAGAFAAKLRGRAAIYAKRHGGKYIVRIIGDDGVRCWRTE